MTGMNLFSEGWGKSGVLQHQKNIIIGLPKYHHYQNIKGYLFKGKIKKTKAWLCYIYCHSWLAVFCNLHWKITDALWFCFCLFFYNVSYCSDKCAVSIGDFRLDFHCCYSSQVNSSLLSSFPWEEQGLETDLVSNDICKYLCNISVERLFHSHIEHNLLLTFIQFPGKSIT